MKTCLYDKTEPPRLIKNRITSKILQIENRMFWNLGPVNIHNGTAMCSPDLIKSRKISIEHSRKCILLCLLSYNLFSRVAHFRTRINISIIRLLVILFW